MSPAYSTDMVPDSYWDWYFNVYETGKDKEEEA